MAAQGNDRCGYCKRRVVPLRRLNSTDLLEMMKHHDPTYTRRTPFCNRCYDRIYAKFMSDKRKRRQRGRRAMSSNDNGTTSYSDVTNADLSSASSSLRRNVEKRTGGPPRTRSNSTSGQENNDPDPDADAGDDDDDDADGSSMSIHLPSDSDTLDQQRNGSNSSSRHSSPRHSADNRSSQPHTSNVDYGNDDDYDPDDDDDGKGNGNDANQRGDIGSVSTLAPMPQYRYKRTKSASSSSAAAGKPSSERSETNRNYKRSTGG